MFSFIKKNKTIIILAIVIIISLQLLSYRIQNKYSYNILDKSIIFLTSPVQAFFWRFSTAFSDMWSDYVFLVGLKEKYKILELDNSKFKSQLFELQETTLENKRLRAALDFKNKSGFSVIGAQIITDNNVGFGKTIRINRGSQDKVEKYMPVMTYEGIVGKTINVSFGYSDVLLITDPTSSVDCVCQRSRARGIIKGQSDEPLTLNMDYVERSEDLIIGDIIITSGIGGVWPKGLPIGQVTKLETDKYGLFKTVKVKPTVNFYKLEEVLIIKNINTIAEEAPLK